MKNYYEILEVSQNASKEVIEKAYKVLAKREHPDLQEESQKENAERKMKLINEAYEVLSDDEKRRNYDIELQAEIQRIKEIEYKKREQENLRNNENKANSNYNNINRINNINYEYKEKPPLTKQQMKEQIRQEKKAIREEREEQERIYRNYMRSLGYRVKEKWTLKRIIKLLKVIGIFIIVILVIWFFPPTHKLLIETYEENEIIKTVVDIMINIIKGLGEGIATFFKSIFIKN